MNKFLLSMLGLAGVCAVALSSAAEPKKPVTTKASAAAAASPSALPPLPKGTSDFIVAIVNQEPITNQDVRERWSVLQARGMLRGGVDATLRETLNKLIEERVQLQLAKDSGLRAEEENIQRVLQSMAAEKNLSPAEFQAGIEKKGGSSAWQKQRREAEEWVILTRLRERELEARIKLTDAEVEQAFQQELQQRPGQVQVLSLAQILVAVPENTAPQKLQQLQARAESLWQRARSGEDFSLMARLDSDAPERDKGGALGARSTADWPDIFIQATNGVAVGAVARPVRSAAGFHVLKVVERQRLPAPVMLKQTYARHILLKPPEWTEAAAKAKLTTLKKQIEAGQLDFGKAAAENSQDASARQGGELGWAAAGMFVPEFDRVMNALDKGQISAPFVSRFGTHLLQVMERREVPLPLAQQKEATRARLRELKLEEAYALWIKEIRAQAYVELREEPH